MWFSRGCWWESVLGSQAGPSFRPASKQRYPLLHHLRRRDPDATGAARLVERVVVLVGLPGVGHREPADRFVERVAVAAIAGDHRRIARLRMGQRKRPAA